MKIIFTSFNPQEAAEFIDFNLIPSTLDEVSQILNDAFYFATLSSGNNVYQFGSDFKRPGPDNATAKWVTQSAEHFDWLCNYFCHLHDLHVKTFKIAHDTASVVQLFPIYAHLFPRNGFTPPPNLAVNLELGVDFRDVADTVQAYKLLVHAQSRSILRASNDL